MAQEKIKSIKDLKVWKKAYQLVLGIYELTLEYPSEEKYGIVAQMRRAAVSIPSNIAEGFGRYGKRDKIHFYRIAHASLEELRCQLLLSRDLGYMKDEKTLLDQVEMISIMLTRLIKSIENS